MCWLSAWTPLLPMAGVQNSKKQSFLWKFSFSTIRLFFVIGTIWGFNTGLSIHSWVYTEARRNSGAIWKSRIERGLSLKLSICWVKILLLTHDDPPPPTKNQIQPWNGFVLYLAFVKVNFLQSIQMASIRSFTQWVRR